MNNPLGEPTVLSHESSTISQTSYYPDHQLLTIDFKRGGSYTYHPVSLGLHAELTLAESVGRAFDALIKKNEGIAFQKGPAADFTL